MLKLVNRPIAALLYASALFAGACGDETTDADFDPVFPGTNEAGASVPDAGAVSNDAGSVPVVSTPQDAGAVVRPLDASITIPAADTGAPVATGDAGGADATVSGDAGPAPAGDTSCCSDANCLCRGPAPTALVSAAGQYKNTSFEIAGKGLVFYPTDATPPFAAVALADGLGGSGGRSGQTASWGPFYASHGIVAMITTTGSGDQPAVRGMKLGGAIAALKAENEKSGSPLFGKLAGRYGTSGYSMGGGGTTHAATADATLKSSIGLAAWQPVGRNVMVPTLFICGDSDGTAPCSMSSGAYGQMPAGTPKMWVEVSGGHGAFGRPSAGGGRAGSYALAFQKVFLEGDTRWRPILVGAMSNATTIK